jgi:hypothetical protein
MKESVLAKDLLDMKFCFPKKSPNRVCFNVFPEIIDIDLNNLVKNVINLSNERNEPLTACFIDYISSLESFTFELVKPKLQVKLSHLEDNQLRHVFNMIIPRMYLEFEKLIK